MPARARLSLNECFAFTLPQWRPTLHVVRVLMSLLLSVMLALPVAAQVREAPSDPDFYYPYDPHDFSTDGPNPSALPNPDLSLRPKPRDSQQLSGVFPPEPEGMMRMIGVNESISTCNGEAVSTLCAVETWLAGVIRRDDKLLAISAGPFWGGHFMPPFPWARRLRKSRQSTASMRYPWRGPPTSGKNPNGGGEIGRGDGIRFGGSATSLSMS